MKNTKNKSTEFLEKRESYVCTRFAVVPGILKCSASSTRDTCVTSSHTHRNDKSSFAVSVFVILCAIGVERLLFVHTTVPLVL